MLAILGSHGLELVPQSALGIEPPVEDGDSFVANALIKARHAAAASALPAIADDSGLEVDALGGRPGVFSSRYAGPDATYADNCRRLLDELDGVDDRSAAFVCVLVGLDARGGMAIACGTAPGTIAPAMRGGEGFGYDPLFVADGQAVTNAELSPAAKDAISHRGQAIRAMAPVLVAELRQLVPAGKEH